MTARDLVVDGAICVGAMAVGWFIGFLLGGTLRAAFDGGLIGNSIAFCYVLWFRVRARP